MSYFNTNGLTSTELEKAIHNNAKQNEIVYLLFKHHKSLTPSQAHHLYTLSTRKNVPLTSIRRAITCLTDKGQLRQTAELKNGIYGKNEHIWKLWRSI
jgi:hypothetical protein